MTQRDKIRNEYIREAAQVGWFGGKTGDARLRGVLDMYGGTMMGILIGCRGRNCQERRNVEGVKAGKLMR